MRNDSDREVQDVRYTDPIAVQIPVNKGPISGIAASPNGGLLMVANHGSDSVSVIDTDIYRVVDTVAGVEEPSAVTISDTDRAFVSTVSAAYDAVQVIDLATGSVVATHPVALSVSDLAASPDGKHVYLTRNGARNADVAVLNVETGHLQVIDIVSDAATSADCVRVSPDGARLYVGVNGPSGGRLVVLETGSSEAPAGRPRWRRKNTTPRTHGAPAVIATIDIGPDVRDVAVSPDGALVYVASTGPEFAVVDVIETRTHKISSTRKVTEVDGILTGLTLSGDGDRAYLVSDHSVTVLCTLTQDVVESLTVTAEPSCVVESRDGRYLYVADYSGAVMVAPTAAFAQTEVEQPALESRRSVDLFVPDLLQYDAALV